MSLSPVIARRAVLPWFHPLSRKHLGQRAQKNLDQDQRIASAGLSSAQFARFGNALRAARLLAAGLRRTAACNFLFPALRLMIGRDWRGRRGCDLSLAC